MVSRNISRIPGLSARNSKKSSFAQVMDISKCPLGLEIFAKTERRLSFCLLVIREKISGFTKLKFLFCAFASVSVFGSSGKDSFVFKAGEVFFLFFPFSICCPPRRYLQKHPGQGRRVRPFRMNYPISGHEVAGYGPSIPIADRTCGP